MPEVEDKLIEWIHSMRDHGVHLTDKLNQEKGHRIFLALEQVPGIERRWGTNFSNGWLDGFKKRNSFKGHKYHGDSADAD